MQGPEKKFHTRNLITKKNSCSSKIPLLPHNFSNGPSLSNAFCLSPCQNTISQSKESVPTMWISGCPSKELHHFSRFYLSTCQKNLLWNGLSILLVRAAEFRCRRIFKQFLFTSELTAKLQNFVRFYNWLCAPMVHIRKMTFLKNVWQLSVR